MQIHQIHSALVPQVDVTAKGKVKITGDLRENTETGGQQEKIWENPGEKGGILS